MAGSYGHVTTDDGMLRSVDGVNDMLDNGGDVYEAIEEMYGMIWYLAHTLDMELSGRGPGSAEELVEDAQHNYEIGLEYSPGKE